jgi:HPr kinase/phosphorylase
MTTSAGPSVHASAVLVGNRAVLIRGPSGSGKSRLAFDLILAGRTGQIAPAQLIGDDRVRLVVRERQVIVRPVPELAGQIEIRGLGIRGCDHVTEATVGLVIDLAAADAERLPNDKALKIDLLGREIPRIPVFAGWDPLPLVVGWFITTERYDRLDPSDDCSKGFGNHISPTIATE